LNLKENCINGKFVTIKHSTIMEHLQLQADRLRRQGRLQEDKMETIIEELKREMVAQEDKGREEEATRLEEVRGYWRQ
jgi:hypothetical protein